MKGVVGAGDTNHFFNNGAVLETRPGGRPLGGRPAGGRPAGRRPAYKNPTGRIRKCRPDEETRRKTCSFFFCPRQPLVHSLPFGPRIDTKISFPAAKSTVVCTHFEGRDGCLRSLADARSVRKSRIYSLLEWGSGGTQLSHGRSKTERVELGAVSAVRPLSRLDPTFCTFFRAKRADFRDFPASFVQFSESFS